MIQHYFIPILFAINVWYSQHYSTEPSQATSLEYCAHDELLSRWLNSEEGNRALMRQYESGYLNFNAAQDEWEGAASYTLPVVFHVIHDGGPSNISDAQVLAALDMLNASFANLGYYDPSTGLDTDISFCLAKQDPMGNASSGINRVNSPLTRFNYNVDDLRMKDLYRWDPLQYINIWVVEEISSNSGSGVAGYAYFPTAHGTPQDGIVVEAKYTGTRESDNAILTHEMGHYLGLYHTFQGGCGNSDCLQDGDRVCDTPPDNTTARPPCNSPTNSCNTDTDSGFASDQTDMIINYMDYSDLSCYSAFTQGQTDRMYFTLENIRRSLRASNVCQDPCPITVRASANVNGGLFYLGQTVQFTNTSINAQSSQWLVNDVMEGSAPDFSYTFSDIGFYEITLQVMGPTPNCLDDTTWSFNVECEAQASFDVNKKVLDVGEGFVATNTSTSANAYQWVLDGVEVSTNQDYATSFANTAIYELFLVVGNGVCKDTSDVILLTVREPGLPGKGLPQWPLLNMIDRSVHLLDWRKTNPTINRISNSSGIGFAGATGAAYDECGGLKFVVVHSGSNEPTDLYIYSSEGEPLLNDNVNAPGLNAVRGGNEIQVVPVPNRDSEWYIIYNEYLPDTGWPINNAAYAATRSLYAHVAMPFDQLVVISRDQVLTAGGPAYTYTDGKAVSRTAQGRDDLHYLYATRRAWRSNTLSLDRWIIGENGITFDANTGEVSAQWWDLSMAGSPVELSPTEDRIAVTNRNQSVNQTDIIVFDALQFSAASAQAISMGDLRLKADGATRDVSSILNQDIIIDQIGSLPNVPLQFLRNFERKISGIEFSPNGRFLYIGNGGFVQGGVTNLTYIGQIDLDSPWPFDIRLQIQTTPDNIYAPQTGEGCAHSAGDCLDRYRNINRVESCFDGNLYFGKRGSPWAHVIPEPDDFMPQNLVPSDVDLSTPSEPNIFVGFDMGFMPDQIDGFNYLNFAKQEIEIVVQKLDCDDECEAPYDLGLVGRFGDTIAQFQVNSCPDTLTVCVDSSGLYFLVESASSKVYNIVLNGGVFSYPDSMEYFDFSEVGNCLEICGNGIDDDGDGLIDCDDPDIEKDCCCLLPDTVDLGPDLVICQNGIEVLDAGEGFMSYEWQDGFAERRYTADGPGWYKVTVTDSCDNISMDSVLITILPASILELAGPFEVCEGDSLAFSLVGFNSWVWNGPGLICDTCSPIVLSPLNNDTFVIQAEYGTGCFALDTLVILVLSRPLITDSITLCLGDTVTYLDSLIFEHGVREFQIQGGDCDTLLTLTVLPGQQVVDSISLKVCLNDSMRYQGQWYTEGTYQVTKTNNIGCDSMTILSIEAFDTIAFRLITDTICPESSDGRISVDILSGPPAQQIRWSTGLTGADEITGLDTGSYAIEILDANGCIQRRVIDLPFYENVAPELSVRPPLCFGEADGEIAWDFADYTTVSINDGSPVRLSVLEELSAGTYNLEFISEEGCTYDTTIIFAEPDPFILSMIDTIEIRYGDSSQWSVQVEPAGSYTYAWSPCVDLSCCECPAPTFSGLTSQTFTVEVQDTNGCTVLRSIYLKVLLTKRVWGPNIFSPNGDNLNDRFTLFGDEDLINIDLLEIYDRWGELVYRGSNLTPGDRSIGWDGLFNGEKMNPAVFTYKARVTFVDGSEDVLSGSLTLLR